MKLLLETNTARVERQGKKTYLEGTMILAGKVNQNQRYYDIQHMSDLVSDLQPTIREGGLVGEISHNHDGATNVDYTRVSHVIKSLKPKGNGEFFGRAEVLKGGGMGKILESCIDAGIRVGTSTRGHGSVQQMKEGYVKVLPDYKLISIDCAHQPSSGAFMNAIKEGIKDKKFSITESAIALKVLQDLGHGLADQQRRMEYSVADNLFRGHAGFPSLGDDDRSHYERLLADTLEMIEKLADLQSRMRNTDGSAQDNQGFSTDTRHLNFSYADAIRDPIKRAQVKQQLWNARTNEIMKNRAMQQLSRISKYNKG